MKKFFELSDSAKGWVLLATLLLLPIIFFIVTSFLHGETQEMESITNYYSDLPLILFFPVLFGIFLCILTLVIKRKPGQLFSIKSLRYILFFAAGNICIVGLAITIAILLLPVFFLGLLLLGLPLFAYFGLVLWTLYKYNSLLIKNVLSFEQDQALN